MKLNEYASLYADLHIPRYHELPDIELYSDQLISYLNKQLSNILKDDSANITTAMINNYVKQGLITPTNKKKYTKNQIAYLLVVCIFKQIYTISEIAKMIKIQKDNFEPAIAYDYFCVELENAIVTTFSNILEDVQDSTITNKPERVLVRSSVFAYAKVLYIRKYLATFEI